MEDLLITEEQYFSTTSNVNDFNLTNSTPLMEDLIILTG